MTGIDVVLSLQKKLMMIRKGFKIKVYREKVAEYIKRHNPIWEELELVLKDHGVQNYSIFLDEEPIICLDMPK